MVDPILIAGAPRSGTSLTAGILHQHGVSVGKHNAHPKFNPKGSFENTQMKSVFDSIIRKHNMPLNPIAADPVEPDLPLLGEKLRKCVEGNPWLLKETKLLWFYQNLSKQFPDAIWVLPVRPRKDSIASMYRHGVLPGRLKASMKREGIDATVQDAAGMYWDKCHNRQHYIANRSKHIWISTHAIAKGDLDESQRLVKACGLDFDESKVKEFINPEYWHA